MTVAGASAALDAMTVLDSLDQRRAHEHAWELRSVEFGDAPEQVSEYGCSLCDAVDFR